MLFKEIINAVITSASRKAKVSPSEESASLWAQVKEKPLNIKQKRIKSLEKAIFKAISKVLDIP